LINAPDIEIILNLTNPAAHEDLNTAALTAGKHVYSEKPLAVTLEGAERLVALAKKKGLLLTCAPDTFYGGTWQTVRKMLDEKWIGEPLFAISNFTSHGHEQWHPNPAFYYQAGGGPLLDNGVYHMTTLIALFGPIESVACFAKTSFKERTITSMPLRGTKIPVNVTTHYSGTIKHKNGVIVSMTISNEIWQSMMPNFEIHGSEGSLFLPEPDFYFGANNDHEDVFTSRRFLRREAVLDSLKGLEPKEAEKFVRSRAIDDLAGDMPILYHESLDNLRGWCVSEMAHVIVNGGKCRASGELATHCLEAMLGFDISSLQNKPYYLRTTCERPEPIPTGYEIGDFC
jgi:predicted dehydrogenase